jgi:hypothetical protein
MSSRIHIRYLAARQVIFLCFSVFFVLEGCASSHRAFNHPTVSGSPIRVGDIISITKKDGDILAITVERITRNGVQGAYGIYVANKDMHSVTIHQLRYKSVRVAPASTAEKVADKVGEVLDLVLSVIPAPE